MAGKPKKGLITAPSRSGGGSSLLLDLIDRAGGMSTKMTPEWQKFQQDPENSAVPEQAMAQGNMLSRMFFPSKNAEASSLNQQARAAEMSRAMKLRHGELDQQRRIADREELYNLRLKDAFYDGLSHAEQARFEELEGNAAEVDKSRAAVAQARSQERNTRLTGDAQQLGIDKTRATQPTDIESTIAGHNLSTATSKAGQALVKPNVETLLEKWKNDRAHSSLGYDLLSEEKAAKKAEFAAQTSKANRSVAIDPSGTVKDIFENTHPIVPGDFLANLSKNGELTAGENPVGMQNNDSKMVRDARAAAHHSALALVAERQKAQNQEHRDALRIQETAAAKTDPFASFVAAGGAGGGSSRTVAGPDGSQLIIEPKPGKTLPNFAPATPKEPAAVSVPSLDNVPEPVGLYQGDPKAAPAAAPAAPVGQAPSALLTPPTSVLSNLVTNASQAPATPNPGIFNPAPVNNAPVQKVTEQLWKPTQALPGGFEKTISGPQTGYEQSLLGQPITKTLETLDPAVLGNLMKSLLKR